MKLAILGTRGIPNNYGGFEQCAEILAVGLQKKGHEVTVYNPSFHNYNKRVFDGVTIKKIYSPNKLIDNNYVFIFIWMLNFFSKKKKYIGALHTMMVYTCLEELSPINMSCFI